MSGNNYGKERWKEVKKPVYIIFLIIFLIFFALSTCGPIIRLYDHMDAWVGFVPLPQFMILLSAWGMAAAVGVLYLVESHFLGKKEKK